MSGGLYPSIEIVERSLNAVVAGTILQRFVTPCDLDVTGLVANLGQAPGAGQTLTINATVTPTSQSAKVSPYNLWTPANVPTISGTSANSFVVNTTATVIQNTPYALNYPLPGPSGTTGYITAQASAPGTSTPVTAPPTLTVFEVNALVAPDNTYTNYNGVAGTPAARLHTGDVVQFVLGGTLGSSSDLDFSLYCQKH